MLKMRGWFTMVRQRCQAQTKNGEACRSFAIDARGFCFAHDPARHAERRAARREGGRGKASAVRASREWIAAGRRVDAQDLPAMLLGLTEAVARGEVEPSRALAMATLCRTAVSIAEHVELYRRLNEVERILDRLEREEPRHA